MGLLPNTSLVTTPLRNILTIRGVLAGFRDGLLHQLYEQPTVQIDLNWFVNTTFLVSFLCLMQGNNDKIRMWKQFSKTEVVAKSVVLFLCFWLVRNVEDAR